MILAAGLGTRLRPLTDSRPKALVEVAGRTLLEIALMRLRAFGINEVITNVHHFADMVVDYLKSHNNFGMRIEISREDDRLLDTGGGLKKAAWFFLEDFRQATASQAQGIRTRSVIPSEGPFSFTMSTSSAPSTFAVCGNSTTSTAPSPLSPSSPAPPPASSSSTTKTNLSVAAARVRTPSSRTERGILTPR